MKRFLMVLLAGIVALQMGCGGGASGAKSLKALPQIKKVAVVSLSMSDWGGSVRGGGAGANIEKTLQDATNKMLTDTEGRLAKQYKVVKAAKFIGNKAYKKQQLERTLNVYVPVVKGKKLGVFTQDSRSIKRGDLEPAKARALCKALGVDGVFLIFSEWTVKTGGFIPLTKAVSKNIVSLWDAQGQKVFTRRVDKMGSRTLGAMGVKAVTPETVNEWTGTYLQSLDIILK
jgi:hypothetical protein